MYTLNSPNHWYLSKKTVVLYHEDCNLYTRYSTQLLSAAFLDSAYIKLYTRKIRLENFST